MANTERLKAIQRVRTALDAALAAQADDKLSDKQRERAETAALKLRVIEGRLIMEEMDDLVADLKKDVAPLRALVNQMKNDVKALRAVAEKVEAAAKAIGVLVDIATKAAASGLV
jgi:hypothetical protein